MQHVIAMFGATLLVPTLTGFPVNTTLLFSGVGTILFLLITRNRLPSYLGSSFAFIAPLAASEQYGIGAQAGSILVTGVCLKVIGFIVKMAGRKVVDAVMPPAVTGAIVGVIGVDVAPAGASSFLTPPVVAAVTLLAIVLCPIAGRGMISRLGILIGVIIGWIFAAVTGNLSEGAAESIADSEWIGLPDLHTHEFNFSSITVALLFMVFLNAYIILLVKIGS